MPEGIPMHSDRGAFDALGYPTEHTNDTDDNTNALHHTLGNGANQAAAGDHIHTLANHDHSGDAGDGGAFDAANLTSGASGDGTVLTSDGAGGAAWEAVPGSHNPVTLDVDAALILDLSTQEIGLDTQIANTVFAGPATAPANEPTFRALVAADLGAGADGTKFLRDDMSWQVAPGGTDANAIHDNVAGEINAITEKVTPIDADLIIIEDSADANNKKKVQIGNLPGGGAIADHDHSGDAGDGGVFDAANLGSGAAGDGQVLTADGVGGAAWEAAPGGTDANAIHDNVAGEINAITEKVTPVDADLIIIEDSADSNNKKKVQIGNLPGGAPGGSFDWDQVLFAQVFS